ncbi:hypothetical protein [Marinobacter sp. MBR-105]|jgi:hypothetical protein
MPTIMQPSDHLVQELTSITDAKATAIEQRFSDYCSVKAEFDSLPGGIWAARIEYHCHQRTWFEVYEHRRPSGEPARWVCTRHMDD